MIGSKKKCDKYTMVLLENDPISGYVYIYPDKLTKTTLYFFSTAYFEDFFSTVYFEDYDLFDGFGLKWE